MGIWCYEGLEGDTQEIKINLSNVSETFDGDELNVKFSFAWMQQENAISSVRKSLKNRNPC
jgi:hypothetical protein